jgi:Uma2 family endonuclease
MTPTIETELPLTLPYQPMRMTVEQYHDLIGTGMFAANERFELLEGVVVEKMTKNPPHVVTVGRCETALAAQLPPGWHIRKQDPITLADSEPEPDLAVVRGRVEDYGERHPGPEDVALVIEVSDASLVTDRYKAKVYAAAGILAYWIVNLPERVVEVHSRPQRAAKKNSYAEVSACRNEVEFPLILDGVEIVRIRASELLPSLSVDPQ